MDLIVVFLATVGAVLGVASLFRTYLSDSERVRVAVIKNSASSVIGIEVANWSPLPVTVTEIGTVHREGRTEASGIDPARGQLVELPKRIGSRDAHLFPISEAEAMAWRVHRPKYVYVRTALRNIFTTERPRKRWLRNIKETLGLKEIDV